MHSLEMIKKINDQAVEDSKKECVACGNEIKGEITSCPDCFMKDRVSRRMPIKLIKYLAWL